MLGGPVGGGRAGPRESYAAGAPELGQIEVVLSKTTRQTRERDGKPYMEYTFDISVDAQLALGPVWRFTARYSSALETHRKLARVEEGSKRADPSFVLPSFPPKHRGLNMVDSKENVERRGREMAAYYAELFNCPAVLNHPMLKTNMAGLCAEELLKRAVAQTPENMALKLTDENLRMVEARRSNLLAKTMAGVSKGMSAGTDLLAAGAAKMGTPGMAGGAAGAAAEEGQEGAEDEEVVKSGQLKMGEEAYTFELGRTALRFFAEGREEQVRSIPLRNAAVMKVEWTEEDQTTKGRECFDIETEETAGRGRMKFRLEAESRAEVDEWMLALLEQQASSLPAAAPSGAPDDAAAAGAERRGSEPPAPGERARGDSDVNPSPRTSVGSWASHPVVVAKPESMVRLWEKEAAFSLTVDAERLRVERRSLLHWVLKEAERDHHQRSVEQTGVKGEGRVRLPRAATATNARTDGVGSYTMADPQEFDLDKDDIVPKVMKTLVQSQALAEERVIDLSTVPRATTFDPDEFPATTVPELRAAFTDEQLRIAAFETLLCCTIVEPPEDNREKKLLDDAYKNGLLQKERYMQKLSELQRAPDGSGELGAAGAVDYDDTSSVSADSSISGDETDEEGGVRLLTPGSAIAVKTTIREQCNIEEADYEELFGAMSVHENDSDKDGTPESALEVGVASPHGDFLPPRLHPAQHVLWRWRCVRQRRPVDFRFFEDYRSWATRQVAMVVCGLLNHIQAHVDHEWRPVKELDKHPELREQIFDEASLQEAAMQDASSGWSRKLSRGGERSQVVLSTAQIAYKLVRAARRVLHLLDYELEFDAGFFAKTLEDMSLIMFVVTAEQLGSLAQSFLPLNCVMYDYLLDAAVFSPRVSSRREDYEDEQERREMETIAMDTLIAGRAEVVDALKYTWRPLKLSHCYHQVLMATSAFKNFQRDPKANMLRLLLDAVRTITQMKQSDEAMVLQMQEQEKLAETLSKVRAFAEERLLDVTNFFKAEHVEEVAVLCGVYAEILKASDDDVGTKLKEAVKASVEANFKRLSDEALFDVDVSKSEDMQQVERLTRLATRLEEELSAGTWRRLLGALREHDFSVLEPEPEPAPEGFDDEMDMGWEEFEDETLGFDPWQEERGMGSPHLRMGDVDLEGGAAREGIPAPSSCWHGYMAPAEEDKWLLSGDFEVLLPHLDNEWVQRYFILTQEHLLVYADPDDDSLAPARRDDRAAKKIRLCTIRLETVASMECDKTEATLLHADGEQRYQVDLPRRIAEHWMLFMDKEIRRQRGEASEDEELQDEEGLESGEWDDPVHRGLMLLVDLLQFEARPVLEEADIDKNMMDCLTSLQVLDETMVKRYCRSETGKKEHERGKEMPATLLQLGVLTESAVTRWVDEKSEEFQKWKDESLRDEDWEPAHPLLHEEAEAASCCASVVDMFQMLHKASQAFESSGMKGVTSPELQAQFASGISATIGDYVRQVEHTCGPHPVLPPPVAPKRGTKQKPRPPKDPRQPTRFTPDVERNLANNTLSRLCTRLNTLVYTQQHIEEDFAIILLEDKGDGNKGKLRLQTVLSTIDTSLHTVRAHIAAKIVHGLADPASDPGGEAEGRRGALLDGLYLQVPDGTFPNHLRRLEEALHLHGQDVTGVPLEMDAVLESLLDQIEQSQREEVMVRTIQRTRTLGRPRHRSLSFGAFVSGGHLRGDSEDDRVRAAER